MVIRTLQRLLASLITCRWAVMSCDCDSDRCMDEAFSDFLGHSWHYCCDFALYATMLIFMFPVTSKNSAFWFSVPVLIMVSNYSIPPLVSTTPMSLIPKSTNTSHGSSHPILLQRIETISCVTTELQAVKWEIRGY